MYIFRSSHGASLQASAHAPSYPIRDPTGSEIRIPATADEDEPYFTPGQHAEIRQYYLENGYVVVRDLVLAALCTAAMARFCDEVKPYDGFIYRKATANPERHVFTPYGFVLNPVLNVQCLDRRRFAKFRDAGLAVMTHPEVQDVVRAILGEPGKIIRSMYFEANPPIWAHQDTYDLDAEETGRMTGAWFALEDIAPGAGRFFVYPESHLVDLARNGGDADIAVHNARYKKLVTDVIRLRGLECRAPALRRGDVLFWSSRTMHGSLDITQPHCSCNALTAHYMPDSARCKEFQTRIRRLNLERIGGMGVHRPKDLNRPSIRAIFWIETTFPKAFRAVKKLMGKALMR